MGKKKKKQQTDFEKWQAEREANFFHIEGGFGYDFSKLDPDKAYRSPYSTFRTEEPRDYNYFSEW